MIVEIKILFGRSTMHINLVEFDHIDHVHIQWSKMIRLNRAPHRLIAHLPANQPWFQLSKMCIQSTKNTERIQCKLFNVNLYHYVSCETIFFCMLPSLLLIFNVIQLIIWHGERADSFFISLDCIFPIGTGHSPQTL